ncbi:uncharacterized protein LOC123547903 [Mercenaria mercenaria]|uniref:uncharacterized protein LOC123547903 n=1 Tax=Mercenaria mercenaria TaxID=6596 RepID=UPI00234F263C|nr:uncharacterized protein LOC123547903 [Mercenaria mercenaria]
MNGSTVHSWINHPGVIDVRAPLEVPYRMEQYAALMWGINEEDTSRSGDMLTMLDGGLRAFPQVTFIGPAGETRFDAGASWDELGGAQVAPPLPSAPQPDVSMPTVQQLPSVPEEEENWRERFLPVIDIEDEDSQFSPLFAMAFGGSENEVKEFAEVPGVDDDSNDEFLPDEYFLDELDE